MTDAFEEVEESLRQDKAAELWNKIYPWLLGALVVLVAAVGAWEFMKWRRDQAIAKDGDVYATLNQALEKRDIEAAKAALAPLAEETDGFGVIANHTLAGLAPDGVEVEPAVAEKHFTKAAQDKGLLGRIAVLKLAYLKADGMNLADLTKLVQPLIDKGGPESALAKELLAAKALDGGNVEKARADYQALAYDLDAPNEMKTRVQQVLLTLPKAPATATPAAPAAAPAQAAPVQPGASNQ